MNIYTLFKIIFIVGYYLGGAECDLAKLFKDAVKQYYSGEGPPATVITIEDYVMQNTRCFMALLRNIHLQLESSEKSSQIDFQEYDHYFTTIIHLLNYDIFKYFHDDIMTIYAEMQRDKPTLDIPLIQAKVSGLIEKGTNLNMWYLETGYIHVRPEDKIVVNYKSNNNFFDECSTMYNKFKNMNEAFNKTLKKAFKTVDFRFNLIKSMPFLMSDSVQNLYDDTQMVKKDMEAEILINEILNLIIKFYGRFIVRMITDAEILLVNAYIEDKATKNFWFLENNVYLKDHIIITRDIVNRMDMIKAKYSYLIDFYKGKFICDFVRKIRKFTYTTLLRNYI
ncbi:Hypothetical protein CINCED_3A008960 [Cinara cedri]|uniref:Uncharacterized protein n=1 Tax=Cinara cedri TaxID=506608 RepID=A0A5E4NAB7_9HEMI|nr:Hypothetical protein CINCED_3A008960 [Cinara cedri]